MAQTVYQAIAALFSNTQPPGPARDFTWRLIRRKRRPFLLLPVGTMSTTVSLSLYSAQRRRAKIWRAVLPFVLNSPAAVIFHRISFSARQNSEIVRFMSEQSGVPVEHLPAPAIKFGGTENQKSRLVLLVCDSTNRPIKVIKLGLDEAGRAATECEANLLEKLPAHMVGCIRVTGRLTTPNLSAFATDYFPGECPEDDLGMETLFQSWINAGPALAIETLESWRELDTQVAEAVPAAWRVLRPALAGKMIRTTLYHGDFAPWNIRAVNLQNLQAFDWERGSLQGVPGWDWFHFVVQTSILARRHSVVRVAAEVEELLQSPRFEKYANAAGIRPIVKPLVLAYLLHHRWIVRPLEGRREVEELFGLLADYWGFAAESEGKTAPQSGRRLVQVPATPQHSLWADARAQLQLAGTQLANVFWEPTLTAAVHPPIAVSLKSGWATILLCCLWLTGVGIIQYLYSDHLMLQPFYAIPCLVAAWKMDRRWGTLVALATALAGPAIAAVKDSEFRHADLFFWNSLMRFITMQMCVFLADRIHRQEDFLGQFTAPRARRADFSRNWAVVLFSCVWFAVIAWGDIQTGPYVSFLPLYLFPAMLMTLFLNLRWGIVMALLGALATSIDEYTAKFNTNAFEVFGWNLPMRCLMLYVVILLLDRLRHESVLFTPRKGNGNSNDGGH